MVCPYMRDMIPKKHPIMVRVGLNLLRLVRNEGMKISLDNALRVLKLCSSDTSETGVLGNFSWWK